jgi:hypothetical protein
MNFDDLLTQDAHEAGAEINILNPNTGEPTDVFIKVLGIDSIAWRSAMKTAIRKMISAKKSDDLTESDLIDEDVEKLVAITVGWRGLTKNGEPLEFSKKACRELYKKSPRIMDQIDRFIGDHRNFTKG